MSRASDVKNLVTEKYRAIPPHQIVTTSNLISILRAFLTLPIIYYLERGRGHVAFIFIVIAIVSDILDGWLARISHAITEIGKVLDPFADGVVILSVTLYLLMDNRVPGYYFGLLAIRYFLIAILGIFLLNNYGISPQSNKLGKISIVFTAATVLSFVYQDKIGNIVIPLMWVSILFLIISGIWYIYTFLNQILHAYRRRKAERNA